MAREWVLFEHQDGRHAAAASVEEAVSFTGGNPGWHRVGPVILTGVTERADAEASRIRLSVGNSNDQLNGLLRVYHQAISGTHSGALVCQRFLLSLYNGHRFPFELTDLRRLDFGNHEACLQVLQLDHLPQREVHDFLAALLGKPTVVMSFVFERWGYDQRLKGRCKKEGLDGLERAARHAEGQAA